MILVGFMVPKMSETSIIWRGCPHNFIIDSLSFVLCTACPILAHHHQSNKIGKIPEDDGEIGKVQFSDEKKCRSSQFHAFFLSINLFFLIIF